MVLDVVRQNGEALGRAPAELRSDRKLVLKASGEWQRLVLCFCRVSRRSRYGSLMLNAPLPVETSFRLNTIVQVIGFFTCTSSGWSSGVLLWSAYAATLPGQHHRWSQRQCWTAPKSDSLPLEVDLLGAFRQHLPGQDFQARTMPKSRGHRYRARPLHSLLVQNLKERGHPYAALGR